MTITEESVEVAAAAMWLYRPMERSEFGAPVPFANAKEYQRTRYLGLARVALEAATAAQKVEAAAHDPSWAPKTAWGTDLWGEVMSEPTEEHARQVAKHHGASVYSRAPMGEWMKEGAI